MIRGGTTQTRAFVYKGRDLISETTPEAGTVTYTYDYNHHVTSRTDAKGQQTVAFQSQTPSNQGPYFAYEYSYKQAGRVTGNRMLVTQGPSYALDLQGQYARLRAAGAGRVRPAWHESIAGPE
jgi:YD repeat-containing protein